MPRPLDNPQLSYHAVCVANDRLKWDPKYLFDMLHEVISASKPIDHDQFSKLCPSSVYREGTQYLYNDQRRLVFPVTNGTVTTILIASKEV